ncbi:hypothetical protein AMTR_s00144p00063150 [Amborella trichopoda]|uniref:Uncharacterized protein n=1 Tax=Amborella trichopoda TaxID=13333 RepID=W1P1H0_AMBTC|nr:hypothetical protein AMTR_s00144p00063150 [Amborella trichopoda]
MYDETLKLVDDQEIIVKRLKVKQIKDGKIKGKTFGDGFSYPGWSQELGSEKKMEGMGKMEKRAIKGWGR